MRKLIAAVRTVFPQLLLLALLLALESLGNSGLIPSTDELTSHVESLFARHGLPLVALCSFLENIVGFNAYFPGSIAILSGMALTAGDPSRAVATYLAILLPAMAANQLCFFLGRRLSGKELGNETLSTKRRVSTLFWLTFWHPHLAATTATAAGAEGLKYTDFLKHFLPASLGWSVFWALTVYHLGGALNLRSNLSWLFYAYLVMWMAWDLARNARKRAKTTVTGYGK